jgi:hypothetical protein
MSFMRESSIAEFLSGGDTASALNLEASEAIERVDSVQEKVYVEALAEPLLITIPMMLRACQAAIAGNIEPIALRAIAFAMISSPAFEWADDLVARVLHDWSAPEVNYALTHQNLLQFRRWLTREEAYPESAELSAVASGGRLLSETTRVEKRA